MNDEEAIKRKMLQRQQEVIQQQAIQQAMSQQAAMQQQMELLKAMMNEILDGKARERLNNLKMVKPDVALQLEVYLAQLYQAGQIRKKITEQEVITILQKLSAKPDFKIRRK